MDLPIGTAFIDLFAADVNGCLRGKRIPCGSWAGVVANGIGFSRGALVLDARGRLQGPLGLGTTDGDPDGIAQPILDMLAPVPWSSHHVAQCLLTMRDQDGRTLYYDPREILRNVIDRCRKDKLHPVVACELEFSLVEADEAGRPLPFQARRAGIAIPGRGHLCVQQIEDYGDFLHRLHEALRAQHLDAETIVSEYGPGQFEVNLKHSADPLRAADHAVLLRRAVIGVAASVGLRATFMAKPFQCLAGNGLHIHVSLLDSQGSNLFAPEHGDALLHAAIGGMQAMLAESLAIFAPSYSAFRRFRPGNFVAMAGSWGENSRAVAFRIPAGTGQARRIEHRLAGADASPHLVVAAVLAAMHFGITERLVPDSEWEEGPNALPADFMTALSCLQEAGRLSCYFPSAFLELFATLKRAELSDLFAEVTPTEHDFYL